MPIDINGKTAGVRIAVKDSRNTKNQIYNYGIKKEATSTFNGLHGSETPTISDKPNVAFNTIIPESSGKINTNLGIVNPDVQELFEATRQLKENSKSLHQSTISGRAPFERMAKADTRQNGRNIIALANRYGKKGGIIDTILTRGMYDINGNKAVVPL